MKTSLIATWGLLSIVLAGTANAQSPSYLKEMPSVERVMREVTGSDAKQTALLQIEALNELQEIVKAMAGPREFRNLTADEGKWIQIYRLAAANASAEADKAFPGPYGNSKRFSLNVPFYPRDYPSFGVATQVFKRFLSPSFRTEFEKAIGADQALHEAFVRAQQQADAQAKARANAGGGDAIANANAVALGNIFSGNSRDTVAIRRCLELGSNQLECTGKGLMSSLGDLAGLNVVPSHVKPGLNMTGIYKSRARFSLTFKEDSADLNGCGELVSDSHKYVVAKKGSQLLIQIASEPQFFVLALGPDGAFSGSGPISINGRIVTGYQSVYVPAARDPEPYGIPAHYAQVAVFAPKTEKCEVGFLYPAGSTTTFASATASAVGVFSGQSPEEAKQATAKVATPPGPRMAGEYAGQGGLKVGFRVDTAILDCGEAHVARPYTVLSTANQVVVTVQNGGVPLTLALQSDGSLTGSGMVDVAGRLMTGMAASGPVFTARSARCAVGTLLAQ